MEINLQWRPAKFAFIKTKCLYAMCIQLLRSFKPCLFREDIQNKPLKYLNLFFFLFMSSNIEFLCLSTTYYM